MEVIRDLLVVFSAAVIVVAILRRLKIPAITGFICCGVLIGPGALGLISDTNEVDAFAEVGVVLLLFSIGLELSFERLKRLWVPILVGGGLQVGATGLSAFLLAFFAFGFSAGASIVVGFVFAVSSTAIVLRGLQERGEIETPHGRLTMGILLFQDLMVVPMLLVVPLLTGAGGPASDFPAALGISVAVIIGVWLAGSLIVPWVLDFVAATRQREIFLLSVILVCAVTAWLVTLVGIKLALGAFLAGLVVAGTRYHHQALADIIPFRDIFVSLFFVSIGMLFRPAALAESFSSIIAILLLILIGKSVIVAIVSLLMRLPLRVAIVTGLALAQVGEFSFIIIHAAGGGAIFDPLVSNNIILAAIISMVLTPFALAAGPRMAAGAMRLRVLTRLLGVPTACDSAQESASRTGHVIIAGYGYGGKKLADSLKTGRVPYVIIDTNPENVREGLARGEDIYLGDATSGDVLQSVGIARAKELVLLIDDALHSLRRAIGAARRVAADIHIVARTRYVSDVEELLQSGADEVVSTEVVGAASVTAIILASYER